ncbi:hypothetical protein K439DRAFT_1616941 [Ramaria rubella]|nr:hypothetical protein K439DRAFT_1616941 [Ramaria rubella]
MSNEPSMDLLESTRKCKTCQQEKPIDTFMFLVCGKKRGQDCAATCMYCAAQNKGWKKAHLKEEEEKCSAQEKKIKPLQESLEPCMFKDFLALLAERRIVVEVEAHVNIGSLDLDLGHEHCHKRADAIASKIGNTMEYHFTYVLKNLYMSW